MQTKNYLADLISKLLSGAITPEENEVLHQFMIKEEHKDMFIDWLQAQWNNESRRMNVVPDQTLFSKIEAEIAGKVGENEKIGETGKPGETGRNETVIPLKVLKNPKWKMLLRYAAVFLLAFVLSWEIQLFTSKGDTIVMVEAEPLYHEILVPYGSKNIVILPDSTKVSLNSGSRLKYPARYDETNREVFLQGEGFFDVTKDPDNPFIVKTNGLNIKVLGTKFNLMANADDNFIEATLIEGAIEILDLKDTKSVGNKNLMMTPGQKLTVQKEKNSYSVLDKEEETQLTIPKVLEKPVVITSASLTKNTDAVELSTAWTENRMVFVKERFETVKTRLERWYGVEIEVKYPEILDYCFTGTFDKETLEQAIDALSKAAHFNYKIDKAHVIVTKK